MTSILSLVEVCRFERRTNKREPSWTIYSRWRLLICFFSPLLGEMIQLGQYVSIGLKLPTSIIQPYVRFINPHLFRGYMRGVFVEHNMSGMTPGMWTRKNQPKIWGPPTAVHVRFREWTPTLCFLKHCEIAEVQLKSRHLKLTLDLTHIWLHSMRLGRFLCVFASVGKPFVFPRFPYAIITSCIPAAVAALVVAGEGSSAKGGPPGVPCCIWVFPKIRVTPKWMVKIMENPIRMDDLGGKPTIFGKHPFVPFIGSLRMLCMSAYLGFRV